MPSDSGVAQDAGSDAGAAHDAGVDAGQDAGSAYEQEVQPIFDSRCGPCHLRASPAPLGSLRLDAGHSWTALVNVEVSGSGCRDAGTFLRVAPGDAGESMLWLKVSGDARKCGAVMPPPQQDGGLNPLTADQQQKIYRWISEGALP